MDVVVLPIRLLINVRPRYLMMRDVGDPRRLMRGVMRRSLGLFSCFTSDASLPTYQAADGTDPHFEYHKNYEVHENVHDIPPLFDFYAINKRRKHAFAGQEASSGENRTDIYCKISDLGCARGRRGDSNPTGSYSILYLFGYVR